MSTVEQLRNEIALTRRELKNIRQESLRQKAYLKTEISKIQAILPGYVPLKETSRPNTTKNIDDRYTMAPIGFISSCFRNKNGIPRQTSLCPSAKGTLTVEKSVFTNPEHSLIGLEEFSHIWVLFLFHKNGEQSSVKAKVHPPRLNGNSVGVFSTRSPHRPSAIGLSLTKLDRIEGNILYLSGIDLLDGTPVLDIKPYIPLYDVPHISNVKPERAIQDKEVYSKNVDSEEVATKSKSLFKNEANGTSNCDVASYLKEPPDNLAVIFTHRALENLESITVQMRQTGNCDYNPVEAKQAIKEVLQNDPRSVYRRHKCTDRLYYFCINDLHVTCWFDDNIAEVLQVKYQNGFSE